MSGNRNQNNLLLEIMIAVLFFALCSGIILETFAAAGEYEARSRAGAEALVQMQNITERIYASEDAEACLEELGFEISDGLWRLDGAECAFELTLEHEKTSAGAIRRTRIRAVRDGETVLEIPGARYLAGGEAG